MALFIIRLKKKKWVLAGSGAVLIVLLILNGFLIPAATDERIKDLMELVEVYYPFLSALTMCTIFWAKHESELIVINGSSLTEIVVYDLIQSYLFTYASGLIVGLLLMPQWISWRFTVSYAVSCTLLYGLAVFARFAVGHAIGSISVYVSVFIMLHTASGIGEGAITRTLCGRDPFLNAYYHGTFSDTQGYWYPGSDTWISNRVMFAVIGVLLLVGGILLTRQKRLYDVRSKL